MNIHEYQAEELLAAHGASVPENHVVVEAAEARKVADRLFALGHGQVVVKAQIHAGGRGKGTFKNGFQGGVKVCSEADQVEAVARKMLGQVLVTKQTGPEGRLVSRLLVAPASEIVKEFYVAVLLDRASSRPLMMASTEGGMDIEEVAARMPERIVRESIDPATGMMPYQARKVAEALELNGKLLSAAAKIFLGIYRTYWECDASMVEVNPLALVKTIEGKDAFVVVDAKIGLDDNALFRQPAIAEMRDLAEESPLEAEADEHNLNYIKLEGDIACLVNGAGLAMATMDIIKHYGGAPANFLDVGGGASQDQVAAAFRIILKDPGVKSILVNIFGGIMDCDVIASGIVAAVRETNLQLPLIVRLEGNNVAAGKETLAASGVKIIRGDSMADAAEKVVRAAVA